jgi:hypothetical protein
MKTKAKSKTKRAAAQRKTSQSHKTNGPRKSIENRDLNEDEQDQITNVERDDDLASAPENTSRNTGFTVEEEEEREKRRKIEDRRPEEPMK